LSRLGELLSPGRDLLQWQNEILGELSLRLNWLA